MGHDPIKYALWIGGISLAITVACALYIVWVNSGSRNLALGLGALVGSFVIFALQIVFELKGTATSGDFVVEFVVDYQMKSVRSAVAYSRSTAAAASYRSVIIEIQASKVLAAAAPPFKPDDAPKVARDLGVLSIISYLLQEQPDWQLDARSFKTSTGTVTQWVGLSPPEECSSVSVETIREKLRAAGNIFAETENITFGRPTICLPPHAVLDLTQNSVSVRSRVCGIIFTLQEPFSSMMGVDPHELAAAKANGQPVTATVPTLSDGSPRYRTVDIAARATVEFAGLRAQDRDLAKYQDWARRVTEGVKTRFEQGVLQ